MHHRALGRPDQVVVADGSAMGVELLAGLQDDGVVTPLGVGELHPVTDPEGTFHGLRPRRVLRRRLVLDDDRLEGHLGEHLGRGRGLVGRLLLV
jgi:hypothetical protein